MPEMTWMCMRCGTSVKIPATSFDAVTGAEAAHVCPSAMPSPPLTELAAAAVTLHELYSSLKEAGFSPVEALQLVAKAMVGAQ